MNRPATRARKEDWVAYAVAVGVPEGRARSLTKAGLVEACGRAAEPAAVSAPAEPRTVEEAVRAELRRTGTALSPLAASAVALARHVDGAASASQAAAAARELRMTLGAATAARPTSDPAEAGDDAGGVVVEPGRLERLRRQAEARGQGG